MTFRGHIRKGQITLDEPAPLPEGAEVTVQLVENHNDALAGIAKNAIPGGLPRDYSEQHDHYVKGLPRK